MLVSPSKKAAMILGLLLLPTMLLTGSMGAAVAFIAGLTVAILAILLSGHLVLIIKMFVQLAIIISLLGGLLYFIVSHNDSTLTGCYMLYRMKAKYSHIGMLA